MERFQQLLIKQSWGDFADDIGNRDISSCDNQKMASFIIQVNCTCIDSAWGLLIFSFFGRGPEK